MRAALVTGLAALVLPAQAAAHGRAATIALDYRIRLDPAAGTMPGLSVHVLDGDRALQARVDQGVDLLVRGSLREPLLRIDRTGVWVNASSPTATADGLVISALPATAARAVCGLALVCGAGAAVLSFLPDFDEPVRAAR